MAFTMTNTLAYYYTELITTIKGFTVQAPGINNHKVRPSEVKFRHGPYQESDFNTLYSFFCS